MAYIKYIIAMIMAFMMTIVAGQSTLTMKALVLTLPNSLTDAITLGLESYGIPYDIVSSYDEDLKLYDDDNQPKYNLVIVNGGNLLHESNGLWISAMSAEQWNVLDEFEAKYRVRRVIISDDVSSNPNVGLFDPNNWGEALDDQPLAVENSKEVQQIFKAAGVKITAPLEVNGIYHTGVSIINEKTTPFLYYAKADGANPIAATITKFDNGREEMSFFFGFGDWSQSSIILNHLWLTWGTHGLFNGFRRVYLTPHIDDVFLSTNVVDAKNNKEFGDEVIRSGPNDFEKLAQFQKDILEEMPAGSVYRAELAFNGNGVLAFVDYDQALSVDGNRYVDLEYVKEPGTGDKRWPSEDYQFSEKQYETMEKDINFNYFNHNETTQKEFFWSSHTFTHENLDDVSKSDVDNEIRLNIDVAKALGLTEKEYWSGGAIITPQISGLHNKDAIEVFQTYGIKSAVGDITRAPITNVQHPYLPFFTTLESSNIEGFPVIPRTPSEIYFSCATSEENTWLYNQIYHDFFGKDSTFEEILDRESSRVFLLLIKLRHESHQFHQTNIYYYEDGEKGTSLLADWTRSVVKRFTQYVDWPIISLKSEDQAETYIRRAKLESCGAETKLLIEDQQVVGVSVSAADGDCTVPVTVPKGVTPVNLPEDATLEQIGHDPLTVWISVKQGESKTFQFETPINWDILQEFEETTTTTVVEPATTEVAESTSTEAAESTTTVVEPATTEVAESTSTEAAESATTEVTEPTTTVVEPVNTEVAESTTTVVEPVNTEVAEKTTNVVEPVNTEVAESTTSAAAEPATTEVAEPTTTAVVEPVNTQAAVGPINTEVAQPTTTEVVETTTTTIEETETPSVAAECANPGYARCGGSGYTGLTCCPEGFVCVEYNEFYSQCSPVE
ncbi:carbohydrate-binding module family 1 protein [Neocallimastix lanati (nom. inval.)]|nr:carbohydrate-binding module family 1 protein [Neocallimastix sp. JGI-2020a]